MGQESSDDCEHTAAAAARLAVGRHASSILHEPNQPLAVIGVAAQNAIDALERAPTETAEAQLRLNRIIAQAARAGEIAEQLRATIRLLAGRLEDVSLDHAVRGAIARISPALRTAGIALRLDRISALPRVEGMHSVIETMLADMLRPPPGLAVSAELHVSAQVTAEYVSLHISGHSGAAPLAPELMALMHGRFETAHENDAPVRVLSFRRIRKS
jgi:C4-dicarboxylate-specific signal transduction histidine kinase